MNQIQRQVFMGISASTIPACSATEYLYAPVASIHFFGVSLKLFKPDSFLKVSNSLPLKLSHYASAPKYLGIPMCYDFSSSCG